MPGLLPRKTTDRRFVAAPLASGNYVVPATIDLRSQLLPSSNQGNSQKCAAYAMAGWLEFYNWKYKGIAEQINPDPIYDRAKQIDGEPVQGTTLEAVLQAAQDLRLISEIDTTSIRQVNARGVTQAIHRYGVVLAAFNITENWMDARPNGWISEGGLDYGGHAVILCGYSLVDNPSWYALQNSWGEENGWRGFNRLTTDLFDTQFLYGLIWDFLT